MKIGKLGVKVFLLMIGVALRCFRAFIWPETIDHCKKSFSLVWFCVLGCFFIDKIVFFCSRVFLGECVEKWVFKQKKKKLIFWSPLGCDSRLVGNKSSSTISDMSMTFVFQKNGQIKKIDSSMRACPRHTRVGFFYFKVQARWPAHANTLSLTFFFCHFTFF